MFEKSLLLTALLATVAAVSLAESTRDVEKAERFAAPARTSIESLDELSAEELEALFEEETASPSREQLSTILGGDVQSELEVLGFRPRPCWCCKFCCCGW